VKASRALAALALAFTLAHVPFLPLSLEDIDSVNFALGVRDFDVATHRPHPPGYPVYILLGKIAKAAVSIAIGGSESVREAKALAIVSLAAGLLAIGSLYVVFAAMAKREQSQGASSARFDVVAFSATVVTVACPLFWYLAVRPMSDLPGLALAAASQACLMRAWWRQSPLPGGDRRLAPAEMSASGRMIVVGAFLAAFSIGLRSQTVWLTFPLLMLVIADRIGRGAAGAILGGGVMFIAGGLAWGIPLLIASGGLNAYLAALGSQGGEDFAGGQMLFATPTARALAFALLRTFVYPWDSMTLGAVVVLLATAGLVQVLWRDRRSLAVLVAMAGPYLIFHLVFQDTSFVRYALPVVPAVAFLAVRGVSLLSERAVPVAAALVSIGGTAVATPVLVAYSTEASPAVRALSAMMNARERSTPPGALAMHQTFVRPLEAEEVGIAPQLPSPPRLEWLELVKYWKAGSTAPLWFLADPMRSDLALIDPASRTDSVEFTWQVVEHQPFGGMRPAAARWYRLPQPGWFAEEGWALTPETQGIAQLRGYGPHLGPINAMVKRRTGPSRVLIGGRHLGSAADPAVRFTLAIDGKTLQQWDAGPGFFLKTFDLPAGALDGSGAWASLTVQSAPVSGATSIPTSIEQFDLQDEPATMWGFDEGWQEAEYDQQFGVWRWTSDRAVLRMVGPTRAVRITMTIESPLRYFDAAAAVKVRAGDRQIASATIDASRDWTFDVPADALAASGGTVTIETDRTFVPAERGGGADRRRLGLRVFAIHVTTELTAAKTTSNLPAPSSR
jgi:hypothetical protein